MSLETNNPIEGNSLPDNKKEREKITINLLIVDDEPVYRKSFSMILKFKNEEGFATAIDEADNLQDALRQIEENDYGIVMTDGMFPENPNEEMSDNDFEKNFRGNQVVEAAKNKGVKLVVGISGGSGGFKGADVVFAKPVDAQELKQLVKETIVNELLEKTT